jgi:glycosyltransferase involved in cell wall biosynthesis
MMPCYDSAATLPLALASLCAQTWEDWECLVVDDGSHDDPRAGVEALGDPRVRYFRFEENRGRGVARQFALDEARGQVLCMLDADDWYYPTKLARQIELLAAEPGVGVASTGVAVFDGSGELVGIRPRSSDGPTTIGRFRRVALAPIPSNPCMIRMELARRARFDAGLHRSQDTDYLLRVLHETTYAFDPRPSYAYLEPPQRFLHKVWPSARCTAKLLWGHRRVDRAGAALAILGVLLKACATTALHAAGGGDWLAHRRSRPVSAAERGEFAAARAALHGPRAAS